MSQQGFPHRVNGPLNGDPGSEPDIQDPPPKPSFKITLPDEKSEEAESEGSEESAEEG
ncbi:MAG TPA: hypothetical protein VF756_14775 [Thermoanaerobaculia bacterium]